MNSKLKIDSDGNHKLKIWMIDPGVAIDKIMNDNGGMKESYLGPSETGVNSPTH